MQTVETTKAVLMRCQHEVMLQRMGAVCSLGVVPSLQ